MDALFLKLLSMSAAAGFLVAAVILLRLVLRRAPRFIHCLLWALVAIRLVCPINLESTLSLIPAGIGSGEAVSRWADSYVEDIWVIEDDSIYYDGAVFNGREPIPDGEGGHYVIAAYDQLGAPATVGSTVVPVFSRLWLSGTVIMLFYAGFSYLRIRTRVRTAVHLRENIWQSEQVSSPFILGFLSPKIYLPFALEAQQLPHVISHERAHLHRRDHWWKPLGFVLLAIHWFNPLIWVAYILLCRDIELACDEKVIKDLDAQAKKAYSQALLSCSLPRHMIAACPLAFGEVGVKTRIKSILSYKKPAFWVVLIAAAACIAAAVCLLTDPAQPPDEEPPPLYRHGYSVTEIPYENGSFSLVMTPMVNTPVFAVTEDFRLLTRSGAGGTENWTCMGTLDPVTLTRENFDPLFSSGRWSTDLSAAELRSDTVRAWQLQTDQDTLIYLLQLSQPSKDKTATTHPLYLAYGYREFTDTGENMIRWLFRLAADIEQDTGNIALSGEHCVPVTVHAAGTCLEEIAESLHWLAIDPGEESVPFTLFGDGREHTGFYRIYDAQTLQPLEFFTPSGLSPQTYLFQNAQPGGRYIVTMTHDVLNPTDIYCFGAELPYTVIPPADIRSESDLLTPSDEAIAQLLDTIASSPAHASAPGDYIAAHPAEYARLLAFGDYALQYIANKFLIGDQTGLHGHLMWSALVDLLGEEAMTFAGVTDGQDYFDRLLASAGVYTAKAGEDYIREHMPKTWLMLESIHFFDQHSIVEKTSS